MRVQMMQSDSRAAERRKASATLEIILGQYWGLNIWAPACKHPNCNASYLKSHTDWNLPPSHWLSSSYLSSAEIGECVRRGQLVYTPHLTAHIRSTQEKVYRRLLSIFRRLEWGRGSEGGLWLSRDKRSGADGKNPQTTFWIFRYVKNTSDLRS